MISLLDTVSAVADINERRQNEQPEYSGAFNGKYY